MCVMLAAVCLARVLTACHAHGHAAQQLTAVYTHLQLRGEYVRIYLKFIILKNYMHRARAALARALAPRATVGGMSQL